MIPASILLWDSFWAGVGYSLGAGAVVVVPLSLLGFVVWGRDEVRSLLHEMGWQVVNRTYPASGQLSDDGEDPVA